MEVYKVFIDKINKHNGVIESTITDSIWFDINKAEKRVNEIACSDTDYIWAPYVNVQYLSIEEE